MERLHSAVPPCVTGYTSAAAALRAQQARPGTNGLNMTYDLTNLATLRDWPLGLSFIDTAWGCFATGLAATVGKVVADKVG